ncbi:LacI family DNA-binding transcriptional regulator [Streptomyces phaeolivaceus]|uniref:LacI family DNA-binding transcriptional regulator n=1 Tax=Streptomyces phaeolivaceus TaxID=2653200 RepID=A0A5P8K798_9ACTN|nr:LacI family DNA-binding transcriptional regulator [Streptomyces phaeolivaceus]QFQ98920.1 LacI family DNA-binding transcriptional regulator [Streptomyces phaeolivaceus]
MGDVARLAGVSAQTVSRVSNGFAGVNEDTRQQVLDAMRELGYRPNSAARALRRGEFRTLGVITFSLSTLGNIRTLDAIATSAAREGYAVTLLPVAVPTQDEVNGAFSRLGELAVDAVIVIMEVHLLDAATVSVPPGVQVVVADSDAGDRYTVVDTDQAGGARDAVRHLLELGHETVWHLAGPEDSFAAQRRANAWRDTLAEAGVPQAPPLVRGDWSAASGYRAGLRIAEEADCTAVFVANDQMALGLLRALNERGRRVPEDVSVVGFDDIPEAASFLPPLTTVHQDFAEVGRLCVEGVLRKMREGEGEGEGVDAGTSAGAVGVEGADGGSAGPEPEGRGTTLVPTRLVRRLSTAAPPTATDVR